MHAFLNVFGWVPIAHSGYAYSFTKIRLLGATAVGAQKVQYRGPELSTRYHHLRSVRCYIPHEYEEPAGGHKQWQQE